VRVIHDPESDTLTVFFAEMPIVESDGDKPGVVLDYDAAGNLVSVEMLNASRHVAIPTRIAYQVGSPSAWGRSRWSSQTTR
jgi:uncharacterized protein YuzE